MTLPTSALPLTALPALPTTTPPPRTPPARTRARLEALLALLGVRLRVAVDRRRLALRAASERGDVPGWVLVTVMTAGIVTALWLFAEPLLETMFSEAIDKVTGPGA